MYELDCVLEEPIVNLLLFCLALFAIFLKLLIAKYEESLMNESKKIT